MCIIANIDEGGRGDKKQLKAIKLHIPEHYVSEHNMREMREGVSVHIPIEPNKT